MVVITVNEGHRYRTEYRLEGVLVQTVIYDSLPECLSYVGQCLKRDMALSKGKVMSTIQGNH